MRPAPTIEVLEARQFLSTYYVSAVGNDSFAGTSTATAWRTIDRVNKQKLKAGDQVLFQAGKSFSGGLLVPAGEGGSSSAPVKFSTYGTGGRATINSGTRPGIEILDTLGVSISNLRFVGSTAVPSQIAAGIRVHTEIANKALSYLRVSNCEVKNYGFEGISIRVPQNSGATVSDVKMDHSEIHDNKYGGIIVTGTKNYANKNFTFDHLKVYNNPGNPPSNGPTGNGIYLADIDTALVQRCVVYNNGTTGAAPVGVWAAGSTRVTLQYNEAYNNHTRTTTDGGGFNFDWDTTNSVMQYNYSHGNDGPAFLLGAGSHVNSGNVIRYNISENDGRRNGRAAIHLWGNVSNASIYNNVVYMPYTGNSVSAALYIHNVGAGGKAPVNVQIRNNVFYTTGGVKLISVTSQVRDHAVNLKFNGNAFYSGMGAFKIQWGDFNVYNSLSSWRSATGQEKLNGAATGYQGDPKLVGVGTGGTIGNADQLASRLGAYKLQSTSPLINKGVTPPTTLAAAIVDFFGDSTPKGGKYDIGADELA